MNTAFIGFLLFVVGFVLLWCAYKNLSPVQFIKGIFGG